MSEDCGYDHDLIDDDLNELRELREALEWCHDNQVSIHFSKHLETGKTFCMASRQRGSWAGQEIVGGWSLIEAVQAAKRLK